MLDLLARFLGTRQNSKNGKDISVHEQEYPYYLIFVESDSEVVANISVTPPEKFARILDNDDKILASAALDLGSEDFDILEHLLDSDKINRSSVNQKLLEFIAQTAFNAGLNR